MSMEQKAPFSFQSRGFILGVILRETNNVQKWSGEGDLPGLVKAFWVKGGDVLA